MMGESRTMTIPVPMVAPLGIECDIDSVREVWDTYIKPGQDRGDLQSVEERVLMAILRSMYRGFMDMGQEETNREVSEDNPAG